MNSSELQLRIRSRIKHCATNRNYYVWWGRVLYTADTPDLLVAQVIGQCGRHQQRP